MSPIQLIAVVVLILLIVGVAIGGGLYLFVYGRYIQRPVPNYDSDAVLPGLDGEVQIIRDEFAIPHIYAETRDDLFRAQGWVHAQDRLWQMEQGRRVAQGRLAEVFGEPALDADRFCRIIGYQRAAEAELPTLNDETRRVLETYCEGVNAFIDAHGNGRLGAEFNLLRVKPEPWAPVDILAFGKVTAWSLSINWESELTRLTLREELGELRAAEVEPEQPQETPITLEALGDEAQQRLQSTAGLLLHSYDNLKGWIEQATGATGSSGGGQGSNSWVLAPKATLGGRPLLCCDPHLSLTMPSTFYENHLVCPDLEVSGASFAGAPGVVIGHNQHIAWGVTNAFTDVQDLYIERQNPDDPTQFEFQGEWESAQVFDETIRVRRGRPVDQRVVVTRHGPLINALLGPNEAAKSTPLALRWTGHEPGQLMRAILGLNTAQNWGDFEAALAQWPGPTSNFTYADDQGHIGYALAGHMPQRDERTLGLVPMPGWNGAHEWGPMIPASELPRVYDPPSGKIVTANNKMVGDDYPYFLGVEFYPGWRAERIEEMLSTKERFSVRDMEQMLSDVQSGLATRVAPWFAQLQSDDNVEQTALSYLRNWNGRIEVDSEAATVYHYVWTALLRLVFADKLSAAGYTRYIGGVGNPLFQNNGFAMRAERRLLELLESQAESPWYADVATGRAQTREELLAAALAAGVRQLRADVGDSTTRWQWGRLHQVRYVHPLGSVRLLRTFFNRGPFPIAGDRHTAMVSVSDPLLPPPLVRVVPSYRQIYEVGAWERTQTVTTSGQSGHPLGAHYDDQITLWREFGYHPMPWEREAVEGSRVYGMRLTGEVEVV